MISAIRISAPTAPLAARQEPAAEPSSVRPARTASLPSALSLGDAHFPEVDLDGIGAQVEQLLTQGQSSPLQTARETRTAWSTNSTQGSGGYGGPWGGGRW